MDADPRRVGKVVAGRAVCALAAAILAITAWAGSSPSIVADDRFEVAWRRVGEVRRVVLAPAGGEAQADPAGRVPLGSLWKLFVHAYLSEHAIAEPAYRCAPGARSPGGEDDYCCTPGGSIGRDEALARSCGPYFDPARIGIGAADWQRFWGAGAPAWLRDLSALKPETEVAVADLLAVLAAVPPAARQKARAALLSVLVEGYAKDTWPILGTAFRFKTYSWHVTQADGTRRPLGGGAGWMDDGTPVWFGGTGASRQVLARYAASLATTLQRHLTASATVDFDDDSPCVEVRFFARYPVQRVLSANGHSASPGVVPGAVRVHFESGSVLPVRAAGRLELFEEAGRPVIRGRFGLDDYVARVVDREGRGEPREAARALAIAARSYVLQRARRIAGCWAIDDSSAMQRVGPEPASSAARAAARFTSGLVLPVPVQYRREEGGRGRLSWRDTVAAANAGERVDALLAKAFGPVGIAGVDGSIDCRRLHEAEVWLASRAASWARVLRPLAGYEAPEPVVVCALGDGHPYADQRLNRVFVRDWMSGQGRLALTHEYLHLAFRHHPNGADEAFVESTARRLEPGPAP